MINLLNFNVISPQKTQKINCSNSSSPSFTALNKDEFIKVNRSLNIEILRDFIDALLSADIKKLSAMDNWTPK